MKRKMLQMGMIALVLAFGIMLMACPTGNDSDSTTTYTVTFDSNGGSPVDAKTVDSGETITLPAEPTKSDHSFGGWFIDNSIFATAFTASTAVTADITVYAKWTKNTGDATLNNIPANSMTAARENNVPTGALSFEYFENKREHFSLSEYFDNSPSVTVSADNIITISIGTPKSDKLLSLEQWGLPANIQPSNPNAKLLSFGSFTNKANITDSERLYLALGNETQNADYVYADSAVDIKGSGLIDGDTTMIWDLSLKPGWNYVVTTFGTDIEQISVEQYDESFSWLVK
jgi:uncharacterized repeat protein (TIGR02543 family)